MQLQECKQLCIELMKQYNIDYTFAWCDAISYAGLCNCRKRQIKLSKPYMLKGTKEQCKRVILHELAHALTKGHGHDRVWKRKLLEMGGDGQRCILDINVQVKPKYIVKCKKCGHEYKYLRKPKLDTLLFGHCRCGGNLQLIEFIG